MSPFSAAALSGFFISLSGSLPLGNLNISAMYIASKENAKNAILFALGVALIELTYLRIALFGISYITDNENIFQSLQWVVVIFLLALSISSFVASSKKQKESKNVLIENNINRFLLGAGMSAVNPIQLPFWAGWVVYLLSTGWIQQENAVLNVFTIGAGIGTFSALILFIIAGRKLSTFMKANNRLVNLIMAILFLVMAGYQVFRILN